MQHLAPLLLDLAVIWLIARLLGEAAERLGQPAVLGELLAGIVVGGAGLAVFQRGVSRWAVGVGMVPRGEVGLIFAGIGLANGVIDAGLYAALVAMVMVSTFVVPPWLRAIYAGSRRAP